MLICARVLLYVLLCSLKRKGYLKFSKKPIKTTTSYLKKHDAKSCPVDFYKTIGKIFYISYIYNYNYCLVV